MTTADQHWPTVDNAIYMYKYTQLIKNNNINLCRKGFVHNLLESNVDI